ncbi:MAG: hypothetical protein JWL84_1860 [Rhodospirillales bacterium]|jgi:hypothetical protein|nr:hypothetical protein [Rhodospirillales bacterium]
MEGSGPDRDGIARLSARASIAIWLILAGAVWGTVGLAIAYTTHGFGQDLRAQADPLPGLIPAAPGAGDR